MMEGPHSTGVEAVYDSLARDYADAFSGDHDRKPMDRDMLRRFAREVGDGQPVWDLGCGPGQTTAYLHALGVNISGMDLSGRILEEARKSHPGIRFRKGNLLETDFKDDSVAGIVAFYAMVHFNGEQVRTAFHEVFRVLRPGGLFLLTFHAGQGSLHLEEFLGKPVNLDVMFFTPGFISGSLADSGFAGIETIEREPYPDVEYQSRRAYAFAKKPGPRSA